MLNKNTYQRVLSLVLKFLSKKLNHSLELVRGGYFVKILLKNRRISNSSKPHYDCLQIQELPTLAPHHKNPDQYIA